MKSNKAAVSESWVSDIWLRLRPGFQQGGTRVRKAAHAWEASDEASLQALEEYFWGSVNRFARLTSSLMHHLPPQACVLDAGAGHGLLAACLKEAGFETHACDIHEGLPIFSKLGIPYRFWHLEGQSAPYSDEYFDAVVLSQTIEHFTYSPRRPLEEILRITRKGGIILIDAPNVSSFRNLWRLMRGRTLFWNFRKHYLEQDPSYFNGIPYYDRHNHEYCRQDLNDIADFFGLTLLEFCYYSSYNAKKRSRAAIVASKLRDAVPHWRKSLYAIYRKP